jgi:hypothetical protein
MKNHYADWRKLVALFRLFSQSHQIAYRSLGDLPGLPVIDSPAAASPVPASTTGLSHGTRRRVLHPSNVDLHGLDAAQAWAYWRPQVCDPSHGDSHSRRHHRRGNAELSP